MEPIGVNGAQISVEVDIGATVSIISENLQHTKVKKTSYFHLKSNFKPTEENNCQY